MHGSTEWALAGRAPAGTLPPVSKSPRLQQSFVVPRSLAGERLDRVLEALSGDLSRSQAQKSVRRGDVFVDGRRVLRSNGALSKGQTLRIERDAPPVRLLFEDEALLVAVKPAGWITHRADRSDAPDFSAHLDASFGPLPTDRGDERPGVVHRLDRETSGVLVVARTSESLTALQDQFRERTVTKRYFALISCPPREDVLVFDSPLAAVPGTLDRQRTDPDGKPARTDVQIVARTADHALCECTIHTGRRHQIRVHLAEAGHPVVGDVLYGTKKQRPLKGSIPPPRLALHASHLAFDHPTSGERLAFDAPLPEDLASIVRGQGLSTPGA